MQSPVSQRRTTRVAAPTRSRRSGGNSAGGSSASPTPTNGTRASRPQTPGQSSRVTAQRATRVRPTDAVRRVVASTRRGGSSNGIQRSARAPAARPDRSSRAPANVTSRVPAPSTAAPSATTRSRTGVVRRSAPVRERAQVTQVRSRQRRQKRQDQRGPGHNSSHMRSPLKKSIEAC